MRAFLLANKKSILALLGLLMALAVLLLFSDTSYAPEFKYSFY